jgi:hypothetical protein
MLAQPHKGYWFWLKGITGWDLRLVQPHRFWFWLKGIAGWDLRLAQPQRFFVLVKGDRKMGSQVSPITQRILALVKTKFEKKKKKKGENLEECQDRVIKIIKFLFERRLR